MAKKIPKFSKNKLKKNTCADTRNLEKSMQIIPPNITVKFLKIKVKEKILKAKMIHYIQGNNG